LNSNRRVYFSARFPHDEPPRISLHRCFAEAPDEALRAVVAMVEGTDEGARRVCERYVEAHDRRASRPPAALPASMRQTRGLWHDLKALAEAVNTRYFGGELDVRVTWGKASRPRRRRRSIQFASYDPSLDLVRVHPDLDAPDVPTSYLDFLIYHELLHKVLGDRRSSGMKRRQTHHAEFRRRERLHPHYEAAQAWEKRFFERRPRRAASPSRQRAKVGQAAYTQLTLFDEWGTQRARRTDLPAGSAGDVTE